jgi:hypothetical protein
VIKLWALSLFAMAVIFCGVLGGRAALLGGPGGPRQNRARATLAAAAIFLSLSLAVWGFVSIIWYLALGTFMLASACGAIIITKKNWDEWFAVSHWLTGFSTIGALYLWIAHWPFGA